MFTVSEIKITNFASYFILSAYALAFLDPCQQLSAAWSFSHIHAISGLARSAWYSLRSSLCLHNNGHSGWHRHWRNSDVWKRRIYGTFGWQVSEQYLVWFLFEILYCKRFLLIYFYYYIIAYLCWWQSCLWKSGDLHESFCKRIRVRHFRFYSV